MENHYKRILEEGKVPSFLKDLLKKIKKKFKGMKGKPRDMEWTWDGHKGEYIYVWLENYDEHYGEYECGVGCEINKKGKTTYYIQVDMTAIGENVKSEKYNTTLNVIKKLFKNVEKKLKKDIPPLPWKQVKI